MAPGRRRGANKAKQKGHLQLGDLVLAKVKGFPAWPAKISMPEDWDRVPDPKKFFVQFFGTQEIAFVAPAEIQEFTNEVKNKVLNRCQGKTVKYFSQAVQEICEEFDHQQQSSGAGVADSGSTLKDEVVPSHELEDEELGFNIKDQNDVELSENTDRDENDKNGDINYISTPKKTKTHSDGADLAKKIPFQHLNQPNLGDGSKTDMDAESDNIASDFGIKSSTAVNNMNHDCILVQDPQEGSGQSLLANGHKVRKTGLNSSEKKKRNMVNGVYNGVDGHSQDNQFLKVEIGFESLGQTGIESSENKSNTRTRPGGRNKPKKISGFNKILKTEYDSNGDVVSSSEPGNGNIIKPKKRGLVNQKSVSHDTEPTDMADGTDLKPPVKKKKSDLPIHLTSRPIEKYPELKNSLPADKPDVLEGDVACSDATCDEAALPLTKRRRRAFEAMVDSKPSPFERTSSNKAATVQKVKPRVKRRALCIDDDDEEEPRTPVHGGFNPTSSTVNPTQQIFKNTPEFHDQITTNSPQNNNKKSADAHVKNNPQKPILKKYNHDDDSMKEYVSPMKPHKELSSPKQQEVAEKKPKKSATDPHSHVVEKLFSKEANPLPLISPRKVATSGNVSKSPKQSNIIKSAGKAPHSVAKKNQSTIPDNGSGFLSKSSRNQSTAPKKNPASVGEVSKPFANRNTYTNHTIVLTEPAVEASKTRTNEDSSTTVLDTKTSESVMSMKNLIAAAQAKRRQAQTHVMSQISSSSSFILPLRTSPGHGSIIQPFSSSNETMQHQAYEYFSHTMEVVSPSTHFPQLAQHQIEVEGSDERRRSSGHYAGDGSLSGGTEAAVARDAFEGMIETLSRTKESIGRATRLAIDCAKYGIANEVVELLVSKLENETSFHRKVDLFFLVDSITQCSHSQKGIAGASYIPIVQSALPRLLAAVAPPGIAAHENRRQCLKVLRLWLERKILPDSLLRRYMEEFGGSNDGTNTGVFLRRPSRAERAVDDPIREMEGMFVDEYGSNASFQLPGFLYSRMFEDEEDEVEPEDKESGGDKSPPGSIFDYKKTDVSHVVATSECKGTTCKSPIGITCGDENAEVTIDTQSDECNNLLVGMVGDLRVEDETSQIKNSKPLTGDSVVMDSDRVFHSWSMDSVSSATLYQSPPLSDGSPPLPLGPPSPLPPLPSSPQSPDSLHSPKPSPPPLPPLSPSPPPPPPPLPPPLSVPFSLLPQSLHPQHLLSSHSQPVVPSASTAVSLQHTLPNRDVANGSQPVSMVGQITHVFSGHEIPSNSQQCQVNQIYQGNTPFPQNNFKHVPPPRTPASHFLYPTSTPLPQHLHPSAYAYGTDEQWRTPLNELTADGHRGVWMNGGRPFGSLVQVPEGYFQAHAERIPNDSKVFQAGTFPSVGPGVSVMMPCRSDIPSTNCWRPV